MGIGTMDVIGLFWTPSKKYKHTRNLEYLLPEARRRRERRAHEQDSPRYRFIIHFLRFRAFLPI